MSSARSYWVYILTNRRNGTLYVGVTGSIEQRIWQHKTKAIEGFAKRYGLDRLVYLEDFPDASQAISFEKQVKGWLRRRKLELIERHNPNWTDLSAGWFDERLDSSPAEVGSE